jgi:hypothetical protein
MNSHPHGARCDCSICRPQDYCRLCQHQLTEPEDGPLYCAPCKLKHPELARRGIDSERREDCQYIINPHIPRDTE